MKNTHIQLVYEDSIKFIATPENKHINLTDIIGKQSNLSISNGYTYYEQPFEYALTEISRHNKHELAITR